MLVEVDCKVGKDSMDFVYELFDYDYCFLELGYCVRCCEFFIVDEMEILLGYVCGYVFYVSYLLEMLYGGKKVDVDLGESI